MAALHPTPVKYRVNAELGEKETALHSAPDQLAENCHFR